jgi:hypothetical protein
MKLKNTLGVVIGSIVAATSLGALAQGQGAVEVEAFGKHYFTDSSRDVQRDGELYGAGVSYFLTDDVSLGLSYGEYHDLTSKEPGADGSHKNIKGSLTSLVLPIILALRALVCVRTSPLALLIRALARPPAVVVTTAPLPTWAPA